MTDKEKFKFVLGKIRLKRATLFESYRLLEGKGDRRDYSLKVMAISLGLIAEALEAILVIESTDDEVENG